MKKKKKLFVALFLCAFIGIGTALATTSDNVVSETIEQIKIKVQCKRCKGKGYWYLKKTHGACLGKGCAACDYLGYTKTRVKCADCDGTGWVSNK
ncbi:MAG: hypothetical protein IJF01_06665 [Tidjanibacter sp.]|nr:hypothetical protein [Tidjanibacter sp.]